MSRVRLAARKPDSQGSPMPIEMAHRAAIDLVAGTIADAPPEPGETCAAAVRLAEEMLSVIMSGGKVEYHAALDIWQDALLRLHQRPALRPARRSRMRAYLVRAARNARNRWLRARSVKRSVDGVEVPAPPEEDAITAEEDRKEAEEVRLAAEGLRARAAQHMVPEVRAVYHAVLRGGLAEEQAAAALGLTRATVRAHVQEVRWMFCVLAGFPDLAEEP